MELKVMYFAAVRDLVERDEETVSFESPQATVAAFVSHLEALHPRLSMEGVRIAVNEEFVDSTHQLSPGDTVALIPPVSGG